MSTDATSPAAPTSPDLMEPILALTRDLKQAAQTLGRREARYLVDTYYQIQRFRITAGHQQRTQEEPECDDEVEPTPEPARIVTWAKGQMERLENNLKRCLGEFASAYACGRWLTSLYGVGPVIAAGLLAELEVEPWKCRSPKRPLCDPSHPHAEHGCGRVKLPHASHFVSFAGLDPSETWEKGQKRPWNARLKTLVVYKLGESVVKTQNREGDFYGHLFAQRKVEEQRRNDEGMNIEYARMTLASKKIGKDTLAYYYYAGLLTPAKSIEVRAQVSAAKQLATAKKLVDESIGMRMLPPAHVHARARRWVAKVFLSHLHHVMHVDWFGHAPAKPYIFEHQPPGANHRHVIEVPNFPHALGGKELRAMGV